MARPDSNFLTACLVALVALTFRLRLSAATPLSADGPAAMPPQLVERCWHADPALRPSFGEVAQALETLADECPTDEEAAALATTRGRVAVGLAALRCRLDEALSSRLAWARHDKGARHCAVDATSDALSADERLLLYAASAHIAAAGAHNLAWAEVRLRRATAVASQAGGVGFATHLANLSRRAHPTDGWRGAGPFQAQWGGARFQRYGPHDVLVQSDEEREWRRRVGERFDAQPARTDDLCRWARVVTVFHACRSQEVALAICGGGFAALATLDAGFYGQGIYFSMDLAYAAEVYGRQMRDEERAAGRGDGLVTVLVCDLAVSRLLSFLLPSHSYSSFPLPSSLPVIRPLPRILPLHLPSLHHYLSLCLSACLSAVCTFVCLYASIHVYAVRRCR